MAETNWRARAIRLKHQLNEAARDLRRAGFKVPPRELGLADSIDALNRDRKLAWVQAAQAVAAHDSINAQASAFKADTLTMLRAIEWRGPRKTCPNCGKTQKAGHVGGCGLALMIFRAGTA